MAHGAKSEVGQTVNLLLISFGGSNPPSTTIKENTFVEEYTLSLQKVKRYFEQYGMEDRVMEFDSSSETVELAAIAIGCEPKQIAKTMSFIVNDEPVLVVMAGDAKIANPKYKEKFSTKAKMIAFEDVGNLIGHDVGGVCPFAINDGVTVYLDISLKRFETVFPAAGSGNSAIGLRIDELEKYSNYKEWVDICKDWE